MVILLIPILLSAFAKKPKVYTVDLLNPPETRWTHIQAEYASSIKTFAESYASQISTEDLQSLITLLNKGYLNPELSQELSGLAKTVNISYDQAVFLNFMYEYNAYCTSIVVNLTNGTVIHGRNLDYQSSEFLTHKNLCFEGVNLLNYLY